MNLSLLYYDIVCYILAVCTFLLCFVYIILWWDFSGRGIVSFNSESQTVEFMWTMIPTMVVLVLCALNIKFIVGDLGCFTNETVKVIGHQWYWSYEFEDGQYSSYVTKSGFSVDKPLRLNYGLFYSLIVTSADVIHSFSVPSLNLKMDAIPGRLNYLLFCPSQHGVFVGYCAELCGVNHSIMPIVIEVIS
nr:cytochrome c oxidase subunit 2 [Raillietina sp. HL-2022]UTE83540.1 cytochrome c oxidase subunit 2 [Raillietina sp. HL-2022]